MIIKYIFYKTLHLYGIFFLVSGDRVHISGPDSAQIGTELTLQCSSQESNPPSLIKWTIGGVQQFGTQEKVIKSVYKILSMKKNKIE